MNQSTSRNISKSVQLKHTKEKLHEMGHDRSNKKKNLVKRFKESYEEGNSGIDSYYVFLTFNFYITNLFRFIQ